MRYITRSNLEWLRHGDFKSSEQQESSTCPYEDICPPVYSGGSFYASMDEFGIVKAQFSSLNFTHKPKQAQVLTVSRGLLETLRLTGKVFYSGEIQKASF